VDPKIPGYMVRKKLQRDKSKGRAGREHGHMRFYLLDDGGGSELKTQWREEMRGRLREGRLMLEWEKGRKRFFEEKGIKIEEMKRREEEWFSEIERKDKER